MRTRGLTLSTAIFKSTSTGFGVKVWFENGEAKTSVVPCRNYPLETRATSLPPTVLVALHEQNPGAVVSDENGLYHWAVPGGGL